MQDTILNSKCQWLNEKDVAEITGLSVSSIQKQRFQSRGIPYSKVGRAVRYLYSDVIDFMEKNRINISA